MRRTGEIVGESRGGREERLIEVQGDKKAGASSKAPGIKNLQRSLKGIGFPLQPTGTIDAATVSAVNAVFQGWDDAPPKLREGNLTAAQISSNLPQVSKYLRKAIGEAQDFGDATKEGKEG